jgi:hypothetical protein
MAAILMADVVGVPQNLLPCADLDCVSVNTAIGVHHVLTTIFTNSTHSFLPLFVVFAINLQSRKFLVSLTTL